MTEATKLDLLTMTTEIVVAAVGKVEYGNDYVCDLISQVYASLEACGQPAPPVDVELVPAVALRNSVKPDYIVCLEDGKRLKMLKRYIATHYDMTPEQYRAKWKLPADYPMTAPNYAEKRRQLAKNIGLGTKANGNPKRGRKPKAA